MCVPWRRAEIEAVEEDCRALVRKGWEWKAKKKKFPFDSSAFREVDVVLLNV